MQGVDKALPLIHGAQGCTFLAKVLLTKHFREPIALAGTKQFAEDIIMGSEENIISMVEGIIEKQGPAVVGVLSSGLSEVKGDDISAVARHFSASGSEAKVLSISTPDYGGGMETGYAAAVEALTNLAGQDDQSSKRTKGVINVLGGCHLTPTDFLESCGKSWKRSGYTLSCSLTCQHWMAADRAFRPSQQAAQAWMKLKQCVLPNSRLLLE